MKKFFLLLTLMAATFIGTSAQQVVIKNNLLYDATSTPNLSLEFGLNKKQTFDVQVDSIPSTSTSRPTKSSSTLRSSPNGAIGRANASTDSSSAFTPTPDVSMFRT